MRSEILWWFIGKEEKIEPQSENDLQKIYEKKFSSWNYPAPDIVNGSSSPTFGIIYNTIHLKEWFKNGVILIGDAAHAVNPISGQGAAISMEDGYILSHLLNKYLYNTQLAFNEYIRLRRPRVDRIGYKSRRSASVTNNSSSFHLDKLRNIAFAAISKFTPERILNRDFYYDAHQVVNQL